MNTKTIEVYEEKSLVGALSRFGNPIPVYDDYIGQLYVYRDSMGVEGIVRAMSWEDAYGICQDEFIMEATETVEELEKEYGEDWIEHECFQESYGFRPNGPNQSDKLQHGIYAKDVNGEALDVLTNEMLAQWEISLVWQDDD